MPLPTARLLLVPLFLLACFATPAMAQADGPFRLIVTHLEPPLVPNSVMDLAVALGYFEREGVNVELVRVQQTPSALAALQSGDGDMANVSVDGLLQAIAAGADDFRAVASPNKSLPFLIAATTEIDSLDDLGDARFGVGRIGSLDHSLSKLVLDHMGLALADTQVVSLGQPNVRAQALLAGQIDATTMSIGTWSTLPDKEGLHILVDQDAYFSAAPLVNKVNAVTTQVLADRPDDVRAVLRALLTISRDFAKQPDLWIEAMAAQLPDTDRQVLDTLARSYASSWSTNGGMSVDQLTYTQDWLFSTSDFAGLPPIALDAWTNFAPLDAVLAEMGVAEGMDPADR